MSFGDLDIGPLRRRRVGGLDALLEILQVDPVPPSRLGAYRCVVVAAQPAPGIATERRLGVVIADGLRVTGVEALLHWNHPQLGAISPAEFIPLAESSGQITAIGGSGQCHARRHHPGGLGLQLQHNALRKFRAHTRRGLNGARIGVISGRYGTTAGPTQGDYVKTTMLDVELEPGAEFRLPVESEATLFDYIVEGSGWFGDSDRTVHGHCAVLFGEGDEFRARADAAGMRFVLCAGRPLREPIAWGGPIVMNTREELEQAFAEIEDGTFIRTPQANP